MTTPDFILALRERVGHDPLWLSSVMAVVVRGEETLMARRADTGAWEPVAGIIEPGEQPAVAAVREVAEEAGVEVVVERVAGIDVSEEIVYANGDRTTYLTVVLRCRAVAGDPRPVDGEASEVRWVRTDALDDLDPRISERVRRRIGWATRDDERAAFLTD